MREPEGMDECVYFTNRGIGDGNVRAWVFRELCPKCKKSFMGKPKDPKTGKAKIRSDEYTCPSCNYTVEKQAYEDTLTICVDYICPKCKNQGKIEVPYKRKKVKRFDEEEGKDKTVDAVLFLCQKCNEKIFITKKMK